MQAPNENDWIAKTRGNLVVAATVIGGMGFQLMLNPPGGVWQSKECVSDDCKEPGTSILADDESKRPYYVGMLISSNVSFSASMCLILILLLVSGLGRGNRFIIAIIKLLMIIAVLCVSAAFFCSMLMIHPTQEVAYIQIAYFGISAVLALVVLVMYAIRLIFPKPTIHNASISVMIRTSIK